MAVEPATQASPQHRFTRVEGQHQLVIDLPMLQSLAGVELNIGQKGVQLCLPGGSPTLIPLPESIASSSEAESGAAKFSKKRGQLTISWTLAAAEASGVKSVEENKADRGIAAAAAAAALPEEEEEVIIEEIVESHADRAEKTSGPSASETADVTSQNCTAKAEARHEVDRGGPAQPAKAYGSLWNANSWHWEEKNCIEMLRDMVRNSLQLCMTEKLKHINALSGASVLLNAIQVDGEASFTLRRGKRILCYEISVAFTWDMRDAYGAALGAKGKANVAELTQDEDAPQVSVEVATTFTGGAEAKAAGEWMRRHGARLVSDYLVGDKISAVMQTAEAARANAEHDAARRKDEKSKAENAQKDTAHERELLAVQQRQLEEARRVKPIEGAVSGSVWNANAWHWEEKQMSSWAHSWLQRKLEGMTVSLLGGLAVTTFSVANVSGDASVSVRKGRPVVLFQIRLECNWTIAESTAGIGEAKGKLVVAEFTSEDGAKSGIELLAGADVKKTRGQSLAALRREGFPAVRAVLAQFVEELKMQLDPKA